MILKSIDNQIVELQILGYQFPEITTPNDWDSNWTRVYLKVQSDKGNWETVDPSLTTGDVKEIVEWLRSLSKNQRVQYKELSFTEPNLVFEVKDETLDPKNIRVSFNLESSPKSIDKEEDFFVDLKISNNVLETAAQELENDLRKIPPR